MLYLFLTTGCDTQIRASLDSDTLLTADREFSKLSVDSGAAYAFKQYLSRDALMLPAGANPIFGLDSIYASMSGNDTSYSLAWVPQKAEIALSGELGWTWGTYTLIRTNAENSQSKSYGKYLNVWKKDAMGNWKVIVDMGNKSPGTD